MNRHTSWMPYGKVLVVDDVPVNIMVTEGLLEPYGLQVDSAASGQEAVDKVRAAQPAYDLVFMDHIMPGMDGIEAAAIIRAWEQEQPPQAERVPIIALTADDTTDSRELFLSRGFNGFISKPIDSAQVDKALNKWVRDKQSPLTLEQAEAERKERERATADVSADDDASLGEAAVGFNIPGVDHHKGIALTGGSEAGYRKILALFCKNAEALLPHLQTAPDQVSLPAFTRHFHSIKGAAASIGAAAVPQLAEKLEAAGRKGDVGFVREHTPGFVERLKELINGIHYHAQVAEKPAAESDRDMLKGMLSELAQILKDRSIPEIDRVLGKLERQSPNSAAGGIVEKISDEVLMSEFDNAIGIIDEFIKEDMS